MDKTRKARRLAAALLWPLALMLTGCGDEPSPSKVQAPGAQKRTDTAMLETGAVLVQDKPPVEALNAYLDGFHFYSGRMHAQMEAHHYCAILNEEVIQCTIFDGNTKQAKLMGVEYIVSERLFATLPETEKPLWHSHVHEVKSGQLIAPGIPAVAEHALMKKLVGTYGKTFHTWHTDQHKELPLGIPQLMMGFTADGQADAAMVEERDRRFGVRSADKRKERDDIVSPPISPGADAWQSGRTVQLADPAGTPHTDAPAEGAQPGHPQR
uniref:OBAP family protein n=1 Tax=Variovorax sp. BK018 TaxID=3450241 RepID=UPI00403A6146